MSKETGIAEFTEIEYFFDSLCGSHLNEKENIAGLSPKIAFRIIYELQETLGVLPDDIELCDYCKKLMETNREGHYDENTGLKFHSPECESNYDEHTGLPENYERWDRNHE